MQTHRTARRLRLLFFESVADFGGGSERVSYDLAIHLSRSGHRVFFVTPQEGTALPSLREAGVTCLIANIGPLPVSEPRVSIRRWLAAAQLVLQTRSDHTFTSVSYLAPLVGSLQAALGTPSAVHLGLVLENTPPALRWAMRLGVLGIAPSTWAMDAWKQRGWPAPNLRFVPNGVNLSRFLPRMSDRPELRARFGWSKVDIVTAFIGRLTPEKGVLTLFRAFASVRAAEPRARLALFGHASDDMLERLKSLSDEIGLSNVAWHWHGPTSEPECVLAAADVATVPSEVPETFGLSVVEAMACGLPVVVSDVSLFPELVGLENRSLVFSSADPVSFMSALLAQISASADQRASLGLRLRDRVTSHFPLAKTVDGYLALFQQTGYHPIPV